MPGIDYSKWDKLDCSTTSSSSNESDQSDEEPSSSCQHGEGRHTRDGGSGGAPRVTRLEYPSRVTLGPSGVQLASAPPKATASPFSQSSPHQPVVSSSDSAGVSGQPGAASAEAFDTDAVRSRLGPEANHCAAAEADAKDDDDEEGEDILYESLARNGGREGMEHWWSQTEDSATVSFLIPWETTAKHISTFCLREVKDEASDHYHAQLDVTLHVPSHRAAATPQSSEEDVNASPSVMHICKQFRYPIKLAEELVEGCWQLHRMPRRHVRLLVVEVFKEPIGQGMTLWCDRCFVSDTASVVDTQRIPDRVQRGAAAGPGAQEKALQFRKVWEEAHEEFRRRVQERKTKQV